MGGAIASAFAATQPERIGQLFLLAPAGMEIVSGKLVKFIVGTPIIGDWLMLAFYPNELRKGIQAERKLPAHVPRISDQQERELRHRGFVPAVLFSLRRVLGKSQQAEPNETHHAGLPVPAI